MTSKKPPNIDLKILKGNWTEESGHKVVASWLKLSTSKSAGFVGVVAQDDLMAIGARKALSELSDPSERSNWLRLPFLGCDGVPETGQQYVRRGLLAATIIYPLVASIAIEMYWRGKASGQIPERTMARPSSFPAMEALRSKAANA
jgi:ribose transport system substrate-binding protein